VQPGSTVTVMSSASMATMRFMRDMSSDTMRPAAGKKACV